MIRKKYYYDLQTTENASNQSVEYNFTTTNLYAVKIKQAYNIEGYGDAVLFGTDGKIYSVTDGYFSTIYSGELTSVPEIICVSYKTKPCLAVFTQDENIIITDEVKKFTAPQGVSHCFFDNRLFCVNERTVYYSKSFDIDIFENDNFILPTTFGNAVKLCRTNDCVIIGCEYGAWKLSVKNGAYCVESFTADILPNSLIGCMAGAIYLSNGGIVFTDGSSIKKSQFQNELILDGTLGYYGGKCYAGCKKTDGQSCVFVYDFTTQKTAFINAKVNSIGGKVGVTDTGIVTFENTEVESVVVNTVKYDFLHQMFGSGNMKKICGVFYTGEGEFSLTVSCGSRIRSVSGKCGKIVRFCVDGRVFDIEITVPKTAKGLEIFYYETGEGL